MQDCVKGEQCVPQKNVIGGKILNKAVNHPHSESHCTVSSKTLWKNKQNHDVGSIVVGGISFSQDPEGMRERMQNRGRGRGW